MAQLKKVVEPFGEVNVYPGSAGKQRVVATILMEPHREGTQTGIALDGSGSMHKLYGIDDGSGVVSSIFAPTKLENQVTLVAQKICAYLARRIDSDGGTTCIYWATGDNGSRIEEVGDFTADQARLGKAIGADLREGKRTLPLIAMLERVPSAEADRVRAVLRGRTLEAAQIEHVRQLVLEHEGVEYARARAQAYAQAAKTDLEVFAPSDEREILTLVADFVVDRDR